MDTVQTFLPYPSFDESARVLDYRLLRKQRTDALIVLQALVDPASSLDIVNTSVTHMWQGHDRALAAYMNCMIREYVRRGCQQRIPAFAWHDPFYSLPEWMGDERLHASHRSLLLSQDPKFYGKYGWKETPDLPLFWPEKKEG